MNWNWSHHLLSGANCHPKQYPAINSGNRPRTKSPQLRNRLHLLANLLLHRPIPITPEGLLELPRLQHPLRCRRSPHGSRQRNSRAKKTPKAQLLLRHRQPSDSGIFPGRINRKPTHLSRNNLGCLEKAQRRGQAMRVMANMRMVVGKPVSVATMMLEQGP